MRLKVVVLFCGLLVSMFTGCVTRSPVASSSAPVPAAAPAWQEGMVGVASNGQVALFCRVTDQQYVALNAEGVPWLRSMGERTHTERYLAGDNVWGLRFKPVSHFGDLCALSSNVAAGIAYRTFGIGEMAREVEKFGDDKRKHFEVSYGLTLLEASGDDGLENLVLGPYRVFEIGVEKELRDRALSQQECVAIRAAMAAGRQEALRLLSEARALRLDRGDLVADLIGIGYGTAVKGLRTLERPGR